MRKPSFSNLRRIENMFKNRFSLFIATFLIIGFFFLALPDKGYSGVNTLGCCNPGGDTCTGCELGDCAIREAECFDELDGISFTTGDVCDLSINSCTDNFEGPGCCVISAGNCNNNQLIGACDEGEGMAWFLDTDCSEVPQCQIVNTPIPTITQWGLIALASILGIVGFIVIRRRKATA